MGALPQADDLAAQMPDKLRDMQQIWTMEASKYQVFPLDDGGLQHDLAALRKEWTLTLGGIRPATRRV